MACEEIKDGFLKNTRFSVVCNNVNGKKIQVAATYFGLNDLEQESQIARRRIG